MDQQPMDTPISKMKSPRSFYRMIMMVALILIVVGFGYLLVNKAGTYKEVNTFNPDVYHAVFMSNGQVYFGKITSMTKEFATVEDIYYLQRTAAPIQPIGEDDEIVDPDSEIQLVKLGGEIHRPTNRMDINRDHLLFIEELRSDSRIVTTILEGKF
ncbi:hypothetical protein IID19_04855 [Patescibacteria group bacterium]|nr:hypothetical protein [Patescibacteria group bacterium]